MHGSLRVRGDRVLPPRGLPDVHLFRRLLRVLLWVRRGGNCSGLLLVRLLRVLTRLTDSTSVVLGRVFKLCGGVDWLTGEERMRILNRTHRGANLLKKETDKRTLCVKMC